MQALQLTEWQHEPELREVDPPEPGPGEVLVKVVAAGACHSDLHLFHDFPPGLVPYELPFTLGHENAGVVEALGAGVGGLEVGQPVAVYGPWGCGRCPACVQGAENYCDRQAEIGASGGGLGCDGGMALAHDRPRGPLPGAARRPRPGRGGAAHRRGPDPLPRHPPGPARAAGRVVGRGDRRRRGPRPPGGPDPASGVAGPGHRGGRPAGRPRAGGPPRRSRHGRRRGRRRGPDPGPDGRAQRRRRVRPRGRRRHDGARRRRGPPPRPPHRRRHRRWLAQDGLLHDALRGDPVHHLLGHAPRAARADRPGGPGPHRTGRPALHARRRARRLPGDAGRHSSKAGP